MGENVMLSYLRRLVANPSKVETQTLWRPISLVFFNAVLLVFSATWAFILVDSVLDEKIVTTSDFVAFYTAGLLIREGEGENIYDLPTQAFYQKEAVGESWEGLILFRYLPFVAALFYPFSRFPIIYAFFLFLGVNLIALLALLIIAKNVFRSLTKYKLWFLLLLAYVPITLSLVKGQVTILLTLVTITVYLLLKKRPFWAGVAYSLFLIKPHFFLSGLPFFLFVSESKREFLKGTFFVSIFLMLFGVTLVGFKSLLLYPSYTLLKEELVFQNPQEWVINFGLASVITPVVKYFGGGLLHIYGLQALLYLLVVFLFVGKVKFVKYDYAFLASVFFMLTLSLHTFPYDYAIILVPIFIVLDQAFKKKNRLGLIFIIILLLILPNVTLAGSILNPLTLFFLGLKFSKIVT